MDTLMAVKYARDRGANLRADTGWEPTIPFDKTLKDLLDYPAESESRPSERRGGCSLCESSPPKRRARQKSCALCSKRPNADQAAWALLDRRDSVVRARCSSI